MDETCTHFLHEGDPKLQNRDGEGISEWWLCFWIHALWCAQPVKSCLGISSILRTLWVLIAVLSQEGGTWLRLEGPALSWHGAALSLLCYNIDASLRMGHTGTPLVTCLRDLACLLTIRARIFLSCFRRYCHYFTLNYHPTLHEWIEL